MLAFLLIALVAVGALSTAACPPRPALSVVAADTSRPPVPAEPNLPDDSAFTVTRPGQALPIYYRNIIGIVFHDTASGLTIRAVLAKYNAVIIGGSPDVGAFGEYIVQVPDPGPTFAALDSLLSRIAREPGVDSALEVTSRDFFDPKGHYPDDGDGVPGDTGRPAIPAYGFPDDSDFLAINPVDTVLIFYRRLAVVYLDDSLPGSQVRAFLRKFAAEIVGGAPYGGGYVIQFPDPGPGWEAYDGTIEKMRAEPGVRSVLKVTRRDFPPRFDSRFPTDGPRLGRRSWFDDTAVATRRQFTDRRRAATSVAYPGSVSTSLALMAIAPQFTRCCSRRTPVSAGM